MISLSVQALFIIITLGTYDFFKRSSIIYYNKAALQAGSDDIITMAESENLQGHAASIKIRIQKY